MAGVEKHQSSGAAIRRMMFNLARKPRYFKREPGKNAKNRLKRLFFPRQMATSAFFRGQFFGKHTEKNGVFRLILALFAVILLE